MKTREYTLQKSFLGSAWLSEPRSWWNPRWYYETIRGTEWFHVYTWMAKDICWCCDYYMEGYAFGCTAVIISFLLVVRAFSNKNWIELYMGMGQFFWLLGNLVWMWGELQDIQYGDSYYYPHYTPINNDYSWKSGLILASTFGYIGLYYVFLPLRLFPKVSEESLQLYNESEVTVHWPLNKLFPTWRNYENIHIFFWLGKDTAWNWRTSTMKSYVPNAVWWVFAVPTVLVGLDFVITSASYQYNVVDHIHYILQLAWIIANFIWAYSEIYEIDSDVGYSLWPVPDTQLSNITVTYKQTIPMRWISAWLLVASLMATFCFTVYWIGFTFVNWNRNSDHNDDDKIPVATEISTNTKTSDPSVQRTIYTLIQDK